jgi:hypothetical protein
MTDPSNALQSFQQELLLHGRRKLQRGVLDQNLFLHFGLALGEPRFTYVRLKGKTVAALVMFVRGEPIKGIFCFGIGKPGDRRDVPLT